MASIFSKYCFANFCKKKKKIRHFIDIIHVYYLKMSDLIHEYLGTVTALMPVV